MIYNLSNELHKSDLIVWTIIGTFFSFFGLLGCFLFFCFLRSCLFHHFVNCNNDCYEANDPWSCNRYKADALFENENIDEQGVDDAHKADQAYKASFALLVGDREAENSANVHQETQAQKASVGGSVEGDESPDALIVAGDDGSTDLVGWGDQDAKDALVDHDDVEVDGLQRAVEDSAAGYARCCKQNKADAQQVLSGGFFSSLLDFFDLIFDFSRLLSAVCDEADCSEAEHHAECLNFVNLLTIDAVAQDGGHKRVSLVQHDEQAVRNKLQAHIHEHIQESAGQDTAEQDTPHGARNGLERVDSLDGKADQGEDEDE